METNKLYHFIENEFGEDSNIEMDCVEGDSATWLGVSSVSDDDDGDGQTRLTWYFQFVGSKEAFAFLVVDDGGDHLFDDFVQALNEDNYKVFCKTWPMLMMAFENGINDNYTHPKSPALIKVTSPLGDEVWVMARKLENIKPEDTGNEYVMGKVSEMFLATLKMIAECNSNDVSTKDKVFLGAKAAKRGWDWANVALGALGVIGTIFGLDAD